MIEWGGRKWVPGKPQPRKPINDIEELLKPLGEKTRMGNVWGSQILNVQKPVESQGPPVSPTPTPSITPTSTITPTPTLTMTPTPSSTLDIGFKLQAENSAFLRTEDSNNIQIEH